MKTSINYVTIANFLVFSDVELGVWWSLEVHYDGRAELEHAEFLTHLEFLFGVNNNVANVERTHHGQVEVSVPVATL